MSPVRRSLAALSLTLAVTPLLLVLTAQPGPSWTCTFGCDAQRDGVVSRPGSAR